MTRPPWTPDALLTRRRAWLLLPVAATVLGLVDSAQVQYERALGGDPITWGHALVHGLPRWYAWALLVPVVLVVSRWIGARGGSAASKVALHLPVAVAVTFVQVAMFSATSSLLHGGPDPLAHLRPALQKYMGLTYLGGLVTYALIVGGWYGWDLWARYRERERETARLGLHASALKANLAEARLRNLQAQLQPHFLFNALHALGGLVLEGETTDAVRMTALLSDLLRRSLRAAEAQEIPLEEELRLVEDYLAIQRLRFADRLDVTVDAEPSARALLVPPLVLQPLVENAVRHGIEADPSAGRVTITCREEGDELVLAVEDDGPGPSERAGSAPEGGRGDAAGPRRPAPRYPPSGPGPGGAGSGVGLSNTRERLRGMYGDAADLSLEASPAGGARAVVRLPRREAPAEAGEGARPAGAVS